MVNHKFLKQLRMISILEGISTLVLFGIAMPLKYFVGWPLAVRIFGSIHGILFLVLLLMLYLAIRRVPISPIAAFLGGLAAIIPFGPFIMDREFKKISDN